MDRLVMRATVLSALRQLRTPSPAMLAAGCAAHPGAYEAATTLGDIIQAEWEAMVDQAIAEISVAA